MAGNGKYLYATLNNEGNVAKIDPKTRKVVDKVATGAQPRSMAIAPDGKSLFVVNYDSSTMSKVRTSDMKVIDTREHQRAAHRDHLRRADQERVALLLHRQHHGLQAGLSRRARLHRPQRRRLRRAAGRRPPRSGAASQGAPAAGRVGGDDVADVARDVPGQRLGHVRLEDRRRALGRLRYQPGGLPRA